MRDHERIEELLAARALGGLEPDDDDALRREMGEHGAACEECRRLESEYEEVAGRLGFALDPVAVRAGLEDEVLARATSEGAPPRPLRPGAGAARAGSARPRGLRTLVAVAASVVLFAAGWAAGSLTGDGSAETDGARVVAFEGGDDVGSLSVAYRPGEDGAYLLGTGLASPPEGSVYEVWLFRDGTPVPATCFTPSSAGSVFTFVDADLATAEAMAVTVEASSCPDAPTTDPILTAEVTA
jgi:hypothetical protein